MKLRHLLTAAVVLACTGLLGLTVFGLHTWQALQQGEEQLDDLLDLRERAAKLRVGLDYVMLLRYEPRLLPDLAADAGQLHQWLADRSGPEAHRAARHMAEIEHLVLALGELVGETRPLSDRSRELVLQQLNIHYSGVDEAIDAMFDQDNRALIHDMRALLLTLLLVGLAFGLACVFAFLAILWRLQRPLTAIQRGMAQFAKGGAAASIPLRGNSELAELARAFNDMARQRSAHEAELQASEARFRQIARVVADAVWDVDLATGSVWWSDGLQPLYGDTQTDRDGDSDRTSFLGVIVPEDRERVVSGVEAAISSGEQEWMGEYRQLRADGSVAEVVSRALILRDENGRATRVLGGTTDLTERRALESRLRQSQRLEAVGQLTGGVAHDFNNLLTVILGNAEELTEALAPDDPLWASADMVRSAAERGAALNRRLLAFARRQVLKPERLDVARVLDELQPLLHSSLGKGMRLEVSLEEDLWPCWLDATELEAALLNLIVNARDAMKGEGLIQVTMRNVTAAPAAGEQPDDYVCVSVEDEGEGMSEAVRERAFEPFYTTKERGKGTGLGLSMVYGFITQSGGHVRVDSAPGEGTRVMLYLPRARFTDE